MCNTAHNKMQHNIPNNRTPHLSPPTATAKYYNSKTFIYHPHLTRIIQWHLRLHAHISLRRPYGSAASSGTLPRGRCHEHCQAAILSSVETCTIDNMPPASLLTHYTTTFSNLRTDKNSKRYTTGKAPHKATLLLSLLTLRHCKRTDLTNIRINMDLTELWSELWDALEYSRAGPIYLPLYHLKSDGFWNISYRTEQRPPQVRSINQFDRTVRTVSLDNDLITLIDDDDSRNALLNALLGGGYFSHDEIGRLKHKIKDMILSFEYEAQLQKQIDREFRMKGEPDDPVLRQSRDPAFRRLVLSSYSSTCAVCRARLVTASGISIIDHEELYETPWDLAGRRIHRATGVV